MLGPVVCRSTRLNGQAGKILLSLTEQEKGTKAKLFQGAMFFVLIFLTQAKDFLIDGRRIKLFGFLRITAGGLGLGAQLTPRG